jgi:hypothetical protein
MLTVEDLNMLPDQYIIDSGIVNDPILHSEPVQWAAVKGFHDWALYYHKAEKGLFFVVTNGEKCTTESIIRKLVPCTQAAFSQYRY